MIAYGETVGSVLVTKMKKLIIIILLLLPTLAFAAPKAKGGNAARDWDILFSAGMPKNPTAYGMSWYFDFPSGNGHVNYVTTPRHAALSGSITMSVAITTTGNPTFDYGYGADNPCLTPASVRPYFFTGDYQDEFGRWWSNQVSIQLAPGTVTITVPLDPALWSSVFGKVGNQDAVTLAAFYAAMQNVSSIGMTFGGGCFHGHGVSVNGGTARFTLIDYKVIP